jgi:hypothetical protein
MTFDEWLASFTGVATLRRAWEEGYRQGAEAMLTEWRNADEERDELSTDRATCKAN